MKRITFVTAALALVLLTAACDTMAGAGQDIQHGGRKLENEANENK
jgi:predicted small secreted protein